MEFQDEEDQQAYRDAELKANEAYALEAQARRAHAAARAIVTDIENARKFFPRAEGGKGKKGSSG
eukprot:4857359-Alexandrium_andersonii.AAC.1